MARVEYFVCPTCGLNRVVKSIRRTAKGHDEVVRFDHARLPEIEDMKILQYREGGGRGSGFKFVDGLTLEQVMTLPEYSDILEDLKSQYIRQLSGFLRIGFISRADMSSLT